MQLLVVFKLLQSFKVYKKNVANIQNVSDVFLFIKAKKLTCWWADEREVTTLHKVKSGFGMGNTIM